MDQATTNSTTSTSSLGGLRQFDLRALIALTTVAAGICAIGREEFWLGVSATLAIVVPAIIVIRLHEPDSTKRIRVFIVGVLVGLLGLLLGYVLRLLWFNVLSNNTRSDRYVTFLENVPLLLGSMLGAWMGGLAAIDSRWRRGVRLWLLITLLIAILGFGFLLWRSRSERWTLAHHVATYQYLYDKPGAQLEYSKEWGRRLLGTSKQFDATIDEHWPKEDYWRVGGLRGAFHLHIRNVQLSVSELEQLSTMPVVTDVVVENATLHSSDLAGLDVSTLQYWRCDVGLRELDQIRSQPNMDCLGLRDVKLTAPLFGSLSSFPKLQSLILSKVDLAELDISKCGTLSWLRISNSNLDDQAIARLATQNTVRMKSATSSPIVDLSLEGNPITDACVEDLLEFKALVSLELTGTKLTAKGIRDIRAAMPTTVIRADENVWAEALYGEPTK